MEIKHILKESTVAVFALLFGLLTVLLPCPVEAQPDMPRQRLSLNTDWKFHLGNAFEAERDFNYHTARLFAKVGEVGGTPMDSEFDDSGWERVDVPHDWAVGLPFAKVDDSQVMLHGYKAIGPLFPENSIGWYRKRFDVDKSDEGKHFNLIFEGVFRNCQVWINGFYLGRHMSGYTGFTFDVADFLHYGGENTIVVRVDATQFEGWFYEGAGIYRNVWLEKHNRVYFADFEPFIHAKIQQPYEQATVYISSGVLSELSADENKQYEITLQTTIYDSQGKQVAQTGKTNRALLYKNEYKDSVQVTHPKLWSLDKPDRYRAVTKLWLDDRLVDEKNTAFGIRDIRIDAREGLFLNGENIKIQGVCMHQDHAGVGSALPEYLQYYRVGLLKEMGVNAYRTTHNAPTPALLEACDSLGMLVLAETRSLNSGEEYLQQFEDLIVQFRNHPSIFMWSIGNEEEVIQATAQGKRIAQTFIRRLQQLDPTRLATYGSNLGNVPEGINEIIPVRGFNYNLHGLDDYHKENLTQPIFGSEVGSTVSTRGVYITDTTKAYLSDFDLNFPPWASTAEHWWTIAAERPWFMGGFVWTGMDYRGEPTPFKWPNINSHFGIMDMCGFPKSIYYYYQSWWTDKDVLHIAPHWNWEGKEGQNIQVWVNSNADEVELLLNSKSLGKKKMPRNGHLTWDVPYEKGILRAVASKKGRKFSREVHTTGKIVGLILETPKKELLPNGHDATVVNVQAVDARGRFVPDAQNEIHFQLDGNGTIIGVGNGDPSSHEADQFGKGETYRRKLFNGKCQVILSSGKKSGELSLTGTVVHDNIKTTIQFMQK